MASTTEHFASDNTAANHPKPRLLIIGPYPPPCAGPEYGTKLLLDSDIHSVFDVRFLNTNVRKHNADKGKRDVRLVLAFFSFIFRLTWLELSFRPDMAYHLVTPTQLGWCGRDLWFLLICKIFHTKAIIHFRGSHLQLNITRFHPLVRFLMHRLCQSVSLALVQANCLINQFEGLVPRERIKVLPNAIEAEQYPVAKCDFRPIVLFMGHATKAKGYCDLVRSIPYVADRIPQVRYVVAGSMHFGGRMVFFDQSTGRPIDDENPFEIHHWIRSTRYKKNYDYVGVVSGEQKLRLLQQAAIFVLPSYSEGFSRALLEAMAVGKPVICTPVGAHREFIADGVNGLVVETGNAKQLAEKTLALLTNKTVCEKISQTNAGYVRECFSADRIVTRFTDYVWEVHDRKRQSCRAQNALFSHETD